MSEPRILLNLFHPHMERSRGNKILTDTVRDLPTVTFRNVYQEYPDFKIDAKREQQLLIKHDLIIFEHPLYWFNCPSLMKEWLDTVYEPGFAFPPGVGDKLKGKHWLTVLTTGGPEESYRSDGFNNFTIEELLRPFQQVANLSSIIWIPPIVIYSILPLGTEGLKNLSDDEIRAHAVKYREYLEGYTID